MKTEANKTQTGIYVMYMYCRQGYNCSAVDAFNKAKQMLSLADMGVENIAKPKIDFDIVESPEKVDKIAVFIKPDDKPKFTMKLKLKGFQS